MNFFQRLFGNKTQEETSETLENHLPPQDLFATDETPQLPEEGQKLMKPLSNLELLMKRNFEPEGYRDGYEEHDLDTMQLQIDSISAEFKRAIREEIDAVIKSLEKLQPHLNDKVKDLMADQYLRLEAKYDSLQLKKAELEAELELAMAEQGYCEMAMKKYRLGFVKGFRFWSDETHFSANL